jgi:hypothetical protein
MIRDRALCFDVLLSGVASFLEDLTHHVSYPPFFFRSMYIGVPWALAGLELLGQYIVHELMLTECSAQ